MATLIYTQGETFEIAVTAPGAVSTVVYVRGPGSVDITGVADPDTAGRWTFTADTAEWTAGLWQYEIWQTDVDGRKRRLCSDQLTINASLANAEAGYDPRSDAERQLERIETYLSTPANLAAARYRINNRELQRYTIAELLQLKRHYLAIVSAERRRKTGRYWGPTTRFRG